MRLSLILFEAVKKVLNVSGESISEESEPTFRRLEDLSEDDFDETDRRAQAVALKECAPSRVLYSSRVPLPSLGLV